MTASNGALDGLRAQWRESERRLYPLATTSPERYEQVVKIARGLADDLASVATLDDLGRAWSGCDVRTMTASHAVGVPIGDLPVSDVAGVGFALRDAELRASDYQHQQQSLVAAARERGDTWVTLHETGNLPNGLLDAYQGIELHLGSGVAIVAAVEPNPATARANYVLTVIRMDPFTAAPTDIDPGIADVQEHDDVESFRAARRDLRALVEGL